MSHRMYSRRSNGRFQRATAENTFGLHVPSCPSCGRLNPYGVNEPKPENCHACGAALSEPECVNCGLPIQLASVIEHWRHSDKGGTRACIINGQVSPDMVATPKRKAKQ